MGLEKLGTLAEQCVKYAQAYGKRTILETKPVGKINFSELGIRLSDGAIRFQTEEAALNYSKNACMQTAKLPPLQQIEIGIGREGNTILGQTNGDRLNCDLAKIDAFNIFDRSKPRTKEFYHYHTDLYGKGKTNPLSIGEYRGDVAQLFKHNLKAITAYNSHGQYNRVPNFNCQLLSEFAKKHKELVKTMAVPMNMWDRFSLLDSLEKLSKKTNFKMSIKNEKEHSVLIDKINSLARKFQETPEYARATHIFWLENAEKYGMKYTTNMTF